MASPQLSCETYRISNVPYDTSEDDVKGWFPEDDQKLILKITHASVDDHLGNSTPPTQIFILTFSKEPLSLKKVRPDTIKALLATFLPNGPPQGAAHCSVDAHFQGLTPLTDSPTQSEAVDIIAVTGVGGRPFGSWQCENTSMWLRDLLPRDLPTVRTFVYGHQLKVINSGNHGNLLSCTEGFLHDLESSRARGSRRPLILVGHSLGGIVVKYAWILCAERSKTDKKYRDLYHAIHSLVLFGTPHNGIRNEEMITVASGQPSEPLLRDLTQGSATLKDLRDRFVSLGAQKHLKVLSCCEYQDTPTSRRDAVDGKVRRDGPGQWMVTEDSARLHWNSDAEKVVPIVENHSMMVKLSGEVDSKYRVIKDYIADFVSDAIVRVPKRFFRADTIESLTKVTEVLSGLTIAASTTRFITQHAINMSHMSSITRTVEDAVLGKALLEDRATPDTAAAFAERAIKIEGLLNPWTRRPFPRRATMLAKTIQEVRTDIQSLWHMLLFTMLPEPIGIDVLGDEARSFAMELGLPQAAELQRLQRLAASPEHFELMPPMHADLPALMGNTDSRAQGLQLVQLQMAVNSNTTQRHTVIIEYKDYADQLQRGRPRLEGDEKQAMAWKERAQRLATLLSKSWLSKPATSHGIAVEDGGMGPGDGDDSGGSGSLDVTAYTFRCMGYIDEPNKGRLALIYQAPPGFIDAAGALAPGVGTLDWLIQEGMGKQPVPLEERFELALRLCSAVLALHSSGWVHKSIRSSNVVLFRGLHKEGEDRPRDVYLKGFQFSREAGGKSDRFQLLQAEKTTDAMHNLYRHPDRNGPPSAVLDFTREHDIFSVGVVLMEIGTWKTMGSRQSFREGLKQGSGEKYKERCVSMARGKLRQDMGNRYAKAVERCLTGELEVGSGDPSIGMSLAFQQLVIDELVFGTKL